MQASDTTLWIVIGFLGQALFSALIRAGKQQADA
jgi:hypothetical protein